LIDGRKGVASVREPACDTSRNGKADGCACAADTDHLRSAASPRDVLTGEGGWQRQFKAVECCGVAIAHNGTGVIDAQRLCEGWVHWVNYGGECLCIGGRGGCLCR